MKRKSDGHNSDEIRRLLEETNEHSALPANQCAPHFLILKSIMYREKTACILITYSQSRRDSGSSRGLFLGG